MAKRINPDRRIWQASAAATIVLLCAWAGCQDSSVAKVDRQRRESMKRTWETLKKEDARAMKSLLATQQEMDKQLRRDAASLRTDFAQLDREVKAEFERWDKKKPRIEAEVLRQLRGNPERLSETAVEFY